MESVPLESANQIGNLEVKGSNKFYIKLQPSDGSQPEQVFKQDYCNAKDDPQEEK